MILQLHEPGTSRNLSTSASTRAVVLRSIGDGDDGTFATMATCNLSTTYVEVQYKCDGQSCAPSSVRRSTLPRDYPAALHQLNGVAGPQHGCGHFLRDVHQLDRSPAFCYPSSSGILSDRLGHSLPHSNWEQTSSSRRGICTLLFAFRPAAGYLPDGFDRALCCH